MRPAMSSLARTAAPLRGAASLFGSRLPAGRPALAARAFSTEHFKASNKGHPLIKKNEYLEREREMSDKLGRQQNHIWSKEELDSALATYNDKHQPVSFSDKLMHGIMYYGLYHPFNFVTGYSPKDPTPSSLVWRLIVLESFAGVPGFVAAGVRHFRSLRVLQRDYGWIHTLLEEAENERMHLLVCLRMFEASPITRFMCISAQLAMTPFLLAVYMVNPKAGHRFVGYLEQTACTTYHNVIQHIETPGTKLHKEWAHLPAPGIAIGYWKLDDDAKWVDALKCIYADETHHRDVNHTFASMESDDPNPFLQNSKDDAARAWKYWEKERLLKEQRQAQSSAGGSST
jgi:hypothetical protein